jgi:hypothetical protein
MEKIERGTIIEIKVPNVEKPIKAVVLDVIENYASDYSACYVYILCAQKRIFRAFNWWHWVVDKGESYKDWSDFIYDGIIVEYCEIPEIPSYI